ncbi:MAG: hypothetical protein R3E42_02740 [Burkholderiaceae bacterium]
MPFAGVKVIGLRESQAGEERLQSMLLAAAGKTCLFGPNYWQSLSEANREVMRKRAKPLANLRNRSEADRVKVDSWLKAEKRPLESLVYLPLVGRGPVLDCGHGAI